MDGLTDLAASRDCTGRWFEDFTPGECFPLPQRTLTDAVMQSFLVASGETHPLHSDAEYCRRRGHPAVLAHSLLVALQTTAGALPFMMEESLVSVLDQSSRCVRPVYAGDTLHPVLQVTELAPAGHTGIVALRSTVHNQHRQLVLDGTQRWRLRKRPLA